MTRLDHFRRGTTHHLLTLSAIILMCRAATSAEVDFVKNLEVKRSGKESQISFSVTAATDVEIGIVNAKGQVVRHLAAGKLGTNIVPPPPLKAGLSQQILWDGQDDAGKPPVGGPFKVRVRLGIKPTFERRIATDGFGSTGKGGLTSNGAMIALDHPLLKGLGHHNAPMTNLNIAASDVSDELWIKGRELKISRVDGLTGKANGKVVLKEGKLLDRAKWGEPVISWDGQYVFYSTSLEKFARFGLSGEPAPWLGSTSHVVSGDMPQGFRHSRGHAAAPDGSVYVLHYERHREGAYIVSQVSPDGIIIRPEVVRLSVTASAIKVDPKGNIFVGARVTPKDRPYPKELDGIVSGDVRKQGSSAWWASQLYATIFKFAPSGGKLVAGGTGEWEAAYAKTSFQPEGVIGTYSGFSHILSHRTPPAGVGCFCNVSRFDIDRYGRVFLPDTFRLSITILDNNMNELRRISYKDISDVGIGLIHQIEVTDRAMYLADPYNNQVLVMSLKAEQEASTAIDLLPRN